MINKQEINAIGYTGKVNVQVLRDKTILQNITINNEGKLPLFRFLANALVGIYSKRGTPKFVSLWAAVGQNELIQKSGMIPYSAVSITESEGAAGATFKFLIPFTAIEDATKISHIRIYNSDISDVGGHIASVDLEDPITTDGKSNVLITWTMQITNKA